MGLSNLYRESFSANKTMYEMWPGVSTMNSAFIPSHATFRQRFGVNFWFLGVPAEKRRFLVDINGHVFQDIASKTGFGRVFQPVKGAARVQIQ